MMLLVPFIDMTRRILVSRGNKTEQMVPTVWACSLAPPTILGYVFFLRLQSYV